MKKNIRKYKLKKIENALLEEERYFNTFSVEFNDELFFKLEYCILDVLLKKGNTLKKSMKIKKDILTMEESSDLSFNGETYISRPEFNLLINLKELRKLLK